MKILFNEEFVLAEMESCIIDSDYLDCDYDNECGDCGSDRGGDCVRD